jgi:hypothetical protein
MSDDEREDAANAAGEVGDFGEWEEDDEEEQQTKCLFSAAMHPSPTAALQHAADAFGFDMKGLYKAHSLDFYSAMQTLNYARVIAAEAGSEGGGAAAARKTIAGIVAGAMRCEKYLIPALDNDPILFEWAAFVGVADDADALEDDEEAERNAIAASVASAAAAAVSGGSSVDAEIRAAAAAGGAGALEAMMGAMGAAAAAADPTAAVLHALAVARAENDALRLQVLEVGLYKLNSVDT